MSVFLSPPPNSAPFDNNGIPNRAWIDWTISVWRIAKKYRGADITANRPTNGLEAGDWYLDTTISKPIWYTGSGWIDATGSSV